MPVMTLEAPSTPASVNDKLSTCISSCPSADKLIATSSATVIGCETVNEVCDATAVIVTVPSCDTSVLPLRSVNDVALF